MDEGGTLTALVTKNIQIEHKSMVLPETHASLKGNSKMFTLISISLKII
jgi:hypothetical protein